MCFGFDAVRLTAHTDCMLQRSAYMLHEVPEEEKEKKKDGQMKRRGRCTSTGTFWPRMKKLRMGIHIHAHMQENEMGTSSADKMRHGTVE